MHKKEKVNSNYKKNYLNTTNYLFNPSIQNADSIYHAPPPTTHTHTIQPAYIIHRRKSISCLCLSPQTSVLDSIFVG